MLRAPLIQLSLLPQKSSGQSGDTLQSAHCSPLMGGERPAAKSQPLGEEPRTARKHQGPRQCRQQGPACSLPASHSTSPDCVSAQQGGHGENNDFLLDLQFTHGDTHRSLGFSGALLEKGNGRSEP